LLGRVELVAHREMWELPAPALTPLPPQYWPISPEQSKLQLSSVACCTGGVGPPQHSRWYCVPQ
jgi:hypothetical protein